MPWIHKRSFPSVSSSSTAVAPKKFNKHPQQDGPPFYYPHTSLPDAWRVLQAHTCRSHDDGDGLTADGEERVGLLAGHRGHALQRVEAAAADVDPALHLRLAEARAEERDGDDVELLLGGVHLLRAPDGGEEICTVDKKKTRLEGIRARSSNCTPPPLNRSRVGTQRNAGVKSMHMPPPRLRCKKRSRVSGKISRRSLDSFVFIFCVAAWSLETAANSLCTHGFRVKFATGQLGGGARRLPQTLLSSACARGLACLRAKSAKWI